MRVKAPRTWSPERTKRHVSELLRLAERLAAADDGLLGRHRHDERVATDRVAVARLHRERAGAERRPAAPDVDRRERHPDQRLGRRDERPGQHGGDRFRIGLVDGGERGGPRLDRRRLELAVPELLLGASSVPDPSHCVPFPSWYGAHRPPVAGPGIAHPQFAAAPKPASAGHFSATIGTSPRCSGTSTSPTRGPTRAAIGARAARSNP